MKLAQNLSLIASLSLSLLAFAGCNPQTLRPQQTPETGVLSVDGGSESKSLPMSGSLKPSPAQEVLVHLDMARALESQNQHEKALSEYQKALMRFSPSVAQRTPAPERARLHRRIASAYDHLGRFDEAKEQYLLAQKLAPEDALVWNDAGYSAYLQGRWDEAASLLKKAVQLDPSDARSQTNLGLTLAASGQTDAAYQTLARVGSPASAHANIAYVLAAQGKTDDARAYYNKALETDTKLPIAHRALAQLDRPATNPATTTPDATLASHVVTESP